MRSIGLLLTFALLGVFSSQVFAAEEYFSTATNTETGDVYYFEYGFAVNNPVGVCMSLGYTNGVTSNGRARCIEQDGSSVYYELDNYNLATVPPDILYPPFDETGSCYEGSTSQECVVDGDTDSDGIPNALDPDSRAYNPDFCAENPTHSICETEGGDDGTGGTGGDGGSGGGSTGWTPPEGSECTSASDTEECCLDFAEYHCTTAGGVFNAAWTDLGGLSCTVQCNDEVDDGTGGNTGGDGSGGDGSGTDGTSFDDTAILGSIDSLNQSNKAEFDEINQQLTDFQNSNTTGLSDVRTAIEALDVDGLEKADLADLENNTATTNQKLDVIEQQLLANQQANTDGLTGVKNQVASLQSDINYIANKPLEGANFEGQMPYGSGDAYINSKFGEFESATGIDKDGELETTVIDLDDSIDDFQPMLPEVSSECPSDYSITVLDKQISFSWTPVCDAFGILNVFVIAAAWIACPFIILGVTKR